MLEKLDEIKELTKWLKMIPFLFTFGMSFFGALLAVVVMKGILYGDQTITYADVMGMFLLVSVIALVSSIGVKLKTDRKIKM